MPVPPPSFCFLFYSDKATFLFFRTSAVLLTGTTLASVAYACTTSVVAAAGHLSQIAAHQVSRSISLSLHTCIYVSISIGLTRQRPSSPPPVTSRRSPHTRYLEISLYLSPCMYLCIYIDQSIYLSICLYPFIHPSIHLVIYLSLCPSIVLSFYFSISG